MKSTVAPNIKRIIKTNGLKQKIVAEKAGFKEKELSNMLNGRKLVSDIDILPLCIALGVTPNELFGVERGA